MMRRCDFAFLAAIASVAASATLLATGRRRAAFAAAGAAAVAGAQSRALSRRSPQPMPPRLWWSLLLPRGRNGPGHLLRLLEPKPGEEILDIGPGVGLHAIPVAKAVAPGGRVSALDVSPAMLARLQRRAARAGVTSIDVQLGNASRLPYPDGTFDAAYLISVLGEIPDRAAAWAELRRVLKPDARLVVGELVADPDFVRLPDLRSEAGAAGFKVDRVLGGRVSYLAMLRRVAG